jgi:opacity protein-like surface antigen
VKRYLLISLLSFSIFKGYSQPVKKGAEIGLFLGCSYYIGDLNPMGHFNQFTKSAGGAVFRYNFNPRLAARISVFAGAIEGDDSFSNSQSQQQRNLKFRSNLSELSGQLEFNFLDYEIGNDYHGFSPYIFAGVAGYKFKPQGNVNDQWVDLQPLGTEGQGLPGGASKRKYKLTQFSIPFGVGVKINLSKRIGISLEWGLRKTFTDYLDDVSTRYYDPAIIAARRGNNAAYLSDPSIGTDPNYTNVGRQRGNPTTKDWYNFSGIAITIKLKEKRKSCPGVYK